MPHDHAFYEMLWVFRGAANHWINDELTRLEEGDLLFIRPGDCHSLWHVEGAPVVGVNLAVPTDVIEAMGGRYPGDLNGRCFWSKDRLPDVLTQRDYPVRATRDLIGRLAKASRTGLALEGFLSTFFASLTSDTVAVTDDMPSWMVDLCHKAHDPALFRQGASTLIATSGRSHSYVCRSFHRHLDQSPTAYLNAIRMRHAARRLTETGDTIAQIAHDCGIANLSHFYKLFMAAYGSAPASYRRERRRDPTRPM